MEIQGHMVTAWYLGTVNAVTFLLYGWDKLAAIRRWRRIPEMFLILMAVFGGSIGALVSMQLFRHKTVHLKFKYGIPLILILQITGTIYLHLNLH